MSEEEFDLTDADAATWLGEKVIEMADRLESVSRFVPGSQSTFAFDRDGVVFTLEMRMRRG